MVENIFLMVLVIASFAVTYIFACTIFVTLKFKVFDQDTQGIAKARMWTTVITILATILVYYLAVKFF